MNRYIALKLCVCLIAVAAGAAATTPPVLSASPSAVDFSYSAGQPTPSNVLVAITASDGSTPAITVVLTPPAGAAANLFPVPPVKSGNVIDVGFDGNTLTQLLSIPPNIYTASLTVSAPGFNNLIIPLAFSVGGSLGVMVAPTSLMFNVPSGTTSQTVQVSGNGNAAISFTLTAVANTGGNWLSATTSASYTPATLTVTINPGNVSSGTYTGNITITPVNGLRISVPVTMQVGTDTVNSSPASLAFTYTMGGTLPPAQVVQISSPLLSDTYTAQAASSGNWLLVDGVTTKISGALPASVNVTVAPAGLAPGTYQGTINISDANEGASVIAVTLAIGGISTVANPSSLVFVAQAGQSTPPSQVIAINGTANANYTAAVNAAWLSISSNAGTAPAQLTVSVNSQGLAPGTYRGNVSIDLSSHGQSIPVTLTVSADPVLMTNIGEIAITYFGGSALPTPVTLNITASSGPALPFTLATGVPPWLKITEASTGLTTPTELTIALAPQTLATGTYLADVILTPTAAGGSSVVVPVLLTILNAPAVGASPTSLAFSGLTGNGPQIKTIEASATANIAFTASAITTTGGPWLSVSPASGTAGAIAKPITVTADATNLAAGTYQGTLTLTTSTGVITLVPVTFTVTSGTGPVAISPAALTFTFTQNGAIPVAQNLQITGSQSFTAGAGTSIGGNWLAVSPGTGVGNATLSVSVAPVGLAAGTYNGSITVTPAGGAPQTVTVTLTVSAPAALAAAPNPLAFAYTAGNPSPAAQSVAVTSTGEALTFTVAASSGGWLGVMQSGATTPATLSVSVDPAGLGAGSYNGSINLSAGAGTPLLVVKVTLTVAAPLPVISAVVNAASYLLGSISPGEIVTIFGTALGPSTGVGAAIDSKGFIATKLANVSVTFNGYAAPVLYASAGQINAIVPYEVAGKSNASAEVIFGSARSNSVSFAVAASEPGIFSADASGKGPGAILDTSYHLVSASNPVSAGATIQVFATGQGQTTPGGTDGLIEPLSLPLPVPLSTPGATVGGVPATIQYIGAAPGEVAGALQINIVIPDGVPSGPAALFVMLGSNSSQSGITVAIQ